jgi:flagellin
MEGRLIMDVTSGAMPSAQVLSGIINTYSSKMEKSLGRIATGLRVNSPADGSGDYFRAQSLGNRAGEVSTIIRDLQVHTSRLDVAESGLKSMQEMLQDMASLAKKASAEDDADTRENYGKEFDSLFEALKSKAYSVNYDGITMLDGAFDAVNTVGGKALTAQVEEFVVKNGSAAQSYHSYSIYDSRATIASGLNLVSIFDTTFDAITAEATWSAGYTQADMTSHTGKEVAQEMYSILTDSGNAGNGRISRNLSHIGTSKSILNSALTYLESKQANYEAARSAIADVDTALETSKYSALQIHQQAAASFLAQSQMTYGSVMGLLTGYSQ